MKVLMFASFLTLILKPMTLMKHCVTEHVSPEYHLIEKCHRSSLTIIARANYVVLSSCQKLALERKGLAINFSPPEVIREEKKDDQGSDEEEQFTCEVLKCPESEIGLSLENDTRFDYYSLYAKPLPPVNASCIPSVGIFFFEENRLNYSQAEAACKKQNGGLVDPSTDARTIAISQLLTDFKVDLAFVGLKSANGTNFISSSGERLDCTTYRAWGPGHPKTRSKIHDCVAVDKNRLWKTVKCTKKLPFICELYPGGPYVPGSMNRTLGNDTSSLSI